MTAVRFVVLLPLLTAAGSAQIERPIAAGETHRYPLALEAGQFVECRLARRGLPVSMSLEKPGGGEAARSSRRILAIAASAGEYSLVVTGDPKSPGAGAYTLEIGKPRAPTPRDLTVVKAQQSMSKAGEYAAALALWREAHDAEGEAAALAAIARAKTARGDNASAIEDLSNALPLEHSAKNARGEYEALRGLAQAYTNLDDSAKAIEYYNAALTIVRNLGDRFDQGVVLNNLGHSYRALGQPQKALECLEEALALRRALNDQLGVAFTTQAIGNVYWAMGENQQALDFYGRSLEIWQALKDGQGEAYTLNNLGLIRAATGDTERAIGYYNRALPIWRRLKFPAGEALTLNNLGMAYAARRETPQALAAYDQARPQFEALGDKRGLAYVLHNAGNVFADSGDNAKALDHYRRSLELKRALGDAYGEAYTLHRMGECYRALGEAEKAAGYYADALRLHESVWDRAGEVVTRGAMARLARDRGDLPEARAQMEHALRWIESSRLNLNSPDLRVSYLASKHSYYEFYTGVLMRLNRERPGQGFDALALEASERARARSLLDTLAEGRVEVRAGIPAALLEKETTLAREMSAQAERVSAQGSNAAAAKRRMTALLEEYDAVRARIRAGSPHYASLMQPEPLGVAAIRQETLDADTELLEFSLGAEKSFGWAVTLDSITAVELPPRGQIEALARRVHEAAAARNRSVAGETLAAKNARLAQIDLRFTRAGAALSRMLLGPLRGQISGHSRLLIVADGALQYVPFAALPEPGRAAYAPLIAKHEVVSLPSASMLAVLRREVRERPAPPGALAVVADPVFASGDPRIADRAAIASGAAGAVRGAGGPAEFPRLRFSRTEADGLLALAAPKKTLRATDFDANLRLVRSGKLGEYALLHFATHAVIDNQHPELSGIVLSLVDSSGRAENGILRLYEIYNLTLPAQVVTLSACETALGKEAGGEGLIGLTRGFMYAGAARVVSTLWNADDQATAAFMKRFYSNMLRQGMKPAAALRSAQLAMWHDRRWNAAYFWAGFTLQGEWN